MNRYKILIITLLAIGVSIFGCFLLTDQQEPDMQEPVPAESYNITKNYTVTGSVKEKGDRLFGIMPYHSEEGDDSRAFGISRSAGVNAQVLGYSWHEVEVEPGVFDFKTIDEHNSIYKDIEIILMLNPIETDWKAVPADLEDVPFDHPEMIERFKVFMTNVFDHFSDLNIEVVLIGNEANSYLYDHNKWDEYKTFYEAVGLHAKTLKPGIKIGVETMWEGIIKGYPEKIKELTSSSDLFATTYYPNDPKIWLRPSMDFMEQDMAHLTTTYSDKPIYILETGYATSPVLKSSEEEQAEFIRKTFKIWDKHADQIHFVNFFLLHDVDREYIEGIYSGLELSEHPNYDDIIESMTTIGLRTYPGKGRDKLAFIVLQKEAEARGW